MKIEFNDLSIIHDEIKDEINKSISKTISENKYILSDQVHEFEREFSKYCNAKYAIGCGNGYDALFLAIKSLDLKKNSKVIVPAMTYAATAFAVVNAGLKLELVDVDKNGLLDLEQFTEALDSSTRLVVPVHLYGQAVNMNKVKNISKKYNLKIIEDCAQAHGGYDHQSNQKLGCLGDIACYSFYPGKNLGAFGDAGAMVTNNKKLYTKLKSFRALGSMQKYHHDGYGVNSRLDELQAAILRIKLKKLDKWNGSRKKIGKYYLNNINFNDEFRAINTTKNSVFHIFNLIVPQRKKFINFMNDQKIPTVMHYPRSINQHKLLKEQFSNKKFINAEEIAAHSVSIPIFPQMKKAQIDYVIAKINYFISKN